MVNVTPVASWIKSMSPHVFLAAFQEVGWGLWEQKCAPSTTLRDQWWTIFAWLVDVVAALQDHVYFVKWLEKLNECKILVIQCNVTTNKTISLMRQRIPKVVTLLHVVNFIKMTHILQVIHVFLGRDNIVLNSDNKNCCGYFQM